MYLTQYKWQSSWVKYTKCILPEPTARNNQINKREGTAFPYTIIPINKCKRNEEENRNLSLDKHHVIIVTYQQDPPMDAKVSGWKLKKKRGICIVSEYLLKIFIKYKEKNIFSSGETQQKLSNSMR